MQKASGPSVLVPSPSGNLNSGRNLESEEDRERAQGGFIQRIIMLVILVIALASALLALLPMVSTDSRILESQIQK